MASLYKVKSSRKNVILITSLNVKRIRNLITSMILLHMKRRPARWWPDKQWDERTRWRDAAVRHDSADGVKYSPMNSDDDDALVRLPSERSDQIVVTVWRRSPVLGLNCLPPEKIMTWAKRKAWTQTRNCVRSFWCPFILSQILAKEASKRNYWSCALPPFYNPRTLSTAQKLMQHPAKKKRKKKLVRVS